MKYNLQNISINKPLYFFIGSKEKLGAYNKRVFGFSCMSGDSELFFVQREDRLYNEIELIMVALEKIIDIINDIYEISNEKLIIEIFSKDLNKILGIVSFLDLSLDMINKMNKIGLSLLERQDIEVKITDYETIPSILEKKINEALDSYITYNDFQKETLYLSSISSRQFDRCLYNLVKDKLIEYVSIYEKGVIGIQKRYITPDDESSVNELLYTIPGTTHSKENNVRLDYYRRTLMVSRDSDLIIACVNTIEENNLLFPDSLIYTVAYSLDIPILILDTKEQIWYTRSVTERRDIVKAKKLPSFKLFKNISFYINTFDVNSTWDIIKKLIKD